MDKSGKKHRKDSSSKNTAKTKTNKSSSSEKTKPVEEQNVGNKSESSTPVKVQTPDKPKVEETENKSEVMAPDVLLISQPPPESKFKKREIESNWSKYEAPIEEDDSAATDFENLVQAPISVGGHFKFKSEKNVQAEITSEYRDYFSLNINKLAENLETLPFYTRHELDQNLFTESEIKTMDSKCSRVATECATKITRILQDNDNNLNQEHLLKSASSPDRVKNTSSPQNVNLKEKLTVTTTGRDDDLDELLELKTPLTDSNNLENEPVAIEEPQLKNISKIVTPINSRTNLENWLDDLLQ